MPRTSSIRIASHQIFLFCLLALVFLPQFGVAQNYFRWDGHAGYDEHGDRGYPNFWRPEYWDDANFANGWDPRGVNNIAEVSTTNLWGTLVYQASWLDAGVTHPRFNIHENGTLGELRAGWGQRRTIFTGAGTLTMQVSSGQSAIVVGHFLAGENDGNYGIDLQMSGGLNLATDTEFRSTMANSISDWDTHIFGAGGLNLRSLNESATLRLMQNNSYLGPTTIRNNFILKVGSEDGTAGTIGQGFLDIESTGQFHLDRSNDYVIANEIRGTGEIFQNGTGRSIFTGSNSFTGRYTVNAGTLQFGNGASSPGSIGGEIVNDSLLTFDHSDQLHVTSLISGGTNIVKNGTGTTVFDNQSSQFSGTLGVNDGTARLMNRSLTLASDFEIASGAVLEFEQTGNSRYENALISGSGIIRKVGPGTTTFDQTASSFSGTVSVEEGTISLWDRSLTLVSDFEVGPNGVLEFNQAGNSRTENGGFSGSGTIRKVGPGYTFIRNDSNTAGFTGTVDVQQGTLQLDEGKFIHANSMTVTNGAAVEMRGQAKWSNSLTVNGSGSLLTAAERLTIDSNTSNSTAGLSLLNGASGVIESLTVGDSQFGQLLVSSGSHISSFRSYLGIGETSSGVATISGNGSQWNHSDFLSVGYGGQGTLNVEAGGVVNNTVGYLANFAGATGTATVTGPGSQWNLSNVLYVGNGGTGTLNIENGGVVNNLAGVLGRNSGSEGTATITGSGSEWINSGLLYVGNSGQGILNVESGGFVSNTNGFLGHNAGSIGTATVTGIDSQWNNSGSLYVGGKGSSSGGTGSLEIRDNGQVTVGGTTKLWNTGTLILDGGTLKTSILDFQEGNFNFLNGILSAEQIHGNLHQDGGTLAAGDSPGSTTIVGDYTLNFGLMDVELAGTTAGSEFDFYQVTGDVNLSGGDLQTTLLNGFSLQLGQEFLFLQVDGALTGTFASYADGDLVLAESGRGLFLSYAAGDGNDVGFFVAAIPEPSAAASFGILCLMGIWRRRRI